MTAGLALTAAELNNVGGSAARGLFAIFNTIDQVKAKLDGYTAQGLVDAALSANLSDANDFKSAYLDLGDMSSIWRGLTPVQTIAGHDFRVFPKRLFFVY